MSRLRHAHRAGELPRQLLYTLGHWRRECLLSLAAAALAATLAAATLTASLATTQPATTFATTAKQ